MQGLGPQAAAHRQAAEALLAMPRSPGGKPDKPQFDYLVTLCGNLYRTLTGRAPSRSKRGEFFRLVNQVTALAASAQKIADFQLLDLPIESDALRKRLSRLGHGQN